MAKKEKTWKEDFEVYLAGLNKAVFNLMKDSEFLRKQEKFNPGVDIRLTVEKAVDNFWGTEAGWENKKRKRSKEINWKLTIVNAISNRMNRVYKPRGIPEDNSVPKRYPGIHPAFKKRKEESKSIKDLLNDRD